MIDLQPQRKRIDIHGTRDPEGGYVNHKVVDWCFKVDGVLHDRTQEDVYGCVVSDAVTASLQGCNCTIMCYGQTGAGKTYTMTGTTENYHHRGVIPRAITQIFQDIACRPDLAVCVSISYLEIYNERLYDLLGTLPGSTVHRCPMVLVEDPHGVYVRGLQSHPAPNEEEALNMLFEGEANRIVSCQPLNCCSSRSHCIFTIYIEGKSLMESNPCYTLAKLHFVDLAGSERLKKSQSEGCAKWEAIHINKSLSFLEHALLALADQHVCHVNYRQSKLTHFLKDSLGGGCGTRLIANIWVEEEQLEDTMSTLRFASRMMCVPVAQCSNIKHDPEVVMRNLEGEVERLRKELTMQDIVTNRSQMTYEPLTEQQRGELYQAVACYLDSSVDTLDIYNLTQLQGILEAFKQHTHQVGINTEARLRCQYEFIEKPPLLEQPEAAAAPPMEGGAEPENDANEQMGEVDPTSGFGAGQASSLQELAASNVLNSKKKEAKKMKKDRQSGGQGSGENLPQTPSTDEAGAAAAQAQNQQLRPSTPPPRMNAFEDFKQDAGCEINCLFMQNKDILSSRKICYSQIARRINSTKGEIDRTSCSIQTMACQRALEGVSFTEEGDVVISEAEYLETQRLAQLKETYRALKDELRAVRNEIQYCENLVRVCREKLVQDFDCWYYENFLNGTCCEDVTPPSAEGLEQHELPYTPCVYVGQAEPEKFERSQMDDMRSQHPEAVPFYNAMMRTQRRRIYACAATQFNMRR